MIVEIKKLTFKCIIGILPYEREHKQKIVIDLKISCKDSDKIIIDYAKTSKFVKKVFKKQKFYTIEKSLLYLEEKLKQKYPEIKKIYMKVSKPNALKNCVAGISMRKKY